LTPLTPTPDARMTSAFLRLSVATAALLLGSVAASAQQAPREGGPRVGDVAPDFTLPAATMRGVSKTPVKLSELRGQTVVIAFYPKARTRGCTVQMQSYRDQYQTLFNNGAGVTVLAVSTDDVETLESWAREEKFPMTFLSDREATIGQLYDVKYPAMNLLRRVLFVVGPDGRIAHVMRPFAELSEDAYVELREAVAKTRAAN
jgi:peroxiredoxin Q/BCP